MYIYICIYIYCILYIYGYQYWMVDHYSGYYPNFVGGFSGFRWEIRPLISGVFKAFPLEVVQLRAPFFNMFLICFPYVSHMFNQSLPNILQLPQPTSFPHGAPQVVSRPPSWYWAPVL